MITQSAFDKLMAMGISLYQLKEKHQHGNYLSIDTEAILNDQFFNNVLNAINISTAEITLSDSTIDLGTILWSFHNEEHISLNANRLVTPSLAQIKTSAQLKNKLYQQLASQQI